MGGQNFKMIFLQFWLQIRIPIKKLPEETIFFFNILKGSRSNKQKTEKIEGKLGWGQFFTVFPNFEGVPIRIGEKERHFPHVVFCKESKSAIRIAKTSFWKFDLPLGEV